MNKSILILISLILILAAMIILPDLTSAQPPPPVKPSQTPIDGGLGLLAAAGGAYAVKKLKNKEAEKHS